MKTTTPLAMHRSEPSPVRQASQVQVINKSFPIVGIGASAGGLEAFSQLLRNLPQKTDRKSTRLNSSHLVISYAVFCLKKKKTYLQSALYAASRLMLE